MPKSKITRAVNAQPAIIPVIGNAVSLLKTLTITDAKAPKAIWILPIKADALPAFLVNGVKASAEEFGKENPWQHRKRKIRKIVPGKLMMLKYEPRNSEIPVIDWQISAPTIISWLSNRRNRRVFN